MTTDGGSRPKVLGAESRLRDAISHATSGWLLLIVSPLALLLVRGVRAHSVAFAAGLAGAVAGSIVTVAAFRRRLWGDDGGRPSGKGLGGIYAGAALAIAVVLAVGAASDPPPRNADRGALGGLSPEAPTVESPRTTDPPSVTSTDQSPGTSAARIRPTFVAPDVLGSINFTESDLERIVTPYSHAGTGRGQAIYDPADVQLCDGVSIPTPKVLDSHPLLFEASGSGYANLTYASEPILYDSVEGAAAMMRDIRTKAESCGYVLRPGVNLGEETIRLAERLEDGYTWDYMIFRWRNVVVQVGARSSDGNHTTHIEQLAAVCSRVLLRVVKK